MVFIPFHHPHRPIQVGIFPLRIVGDHVIFSNKLKPMAFQVRLIHNVQTIFVTKLVEPGVIGIVSRSYGIDVVLFHHQHIPIHMLQSHNPSRLRMSFMAVYSPKHYRFAIYKHFAVFYLDISKANVLGNKL